jgi:hypothetical protein
MSTLVFHARLTAAPDPAYPPARLKAGGDVRAAAWADCLHLLRLLAEFGPGSVQVALRYHFDPAATHRQERLRVYLTGHAPDPAVAASLELLLRRGPLQRFYTLQTAAPPPLDWRPFTAATDVVRRQLLLDPTVSVEFNPHALPAYYVLTPFEAARDHDFLRLDHLLDRVDQPALIELCVEPAAGAPLLAANTRYLARLQQINQTWDYEDDESLSTLSGAASGRTRLKPLRQKDPLVDEVLRRQRRCHELLTQPQLRFHFRAFAPSAALAHLLASVVAESAFADGAYELCDATRADPDFQSLVQEQPAPRVVAAPALAARLRARELHLFETLASQGSCASVEELAGAFRLPVALHASPRCLRMDTDPPAAPADDLVVVGQDLLAAESAASDGAGGVPRGIRLGDLPKHMFISGIPGSGKTVAALGLLSQLAQRGVPVLVLEPAKSEYRLLKQLTGSPLPHVRRLAAELQVYTPGSPVSPLRLNPLRVPAGIGRDEHIENLLACFKAAMPMEGSMLGLLGEALELTYERRPDSGAPPRMGDVHTALRAVLASKHYSADVESDLRAAFDTRLGVLTRRAVGRVLQCPQDVPALAQLLSGRCLVELGALPNEQACLLTLFLLTAIREQVKVTPWTGPAPRLVLLLEEAHNLVGRSAAAAASAENADPKAHASEYLCRMLAELRSAGVALVILDQLPSAIAPEVVKHTGSKLAFRQVDTEDRETLGGAMLFGPLELEEIARLRPGEAFLHTEGYFGPRRIRTPNLPAEWGLPAPALDDGLRASLRRDPWFLAAANARVGAELEQLMAALDDLEQVCSRGASRCTAMLAARASLLASANSPKRGAQLAALRRTARALGLELQAALRHFRRAHWGPLLADAPPAEVLDAALTALRQQLIQRFESVIVPGLQATTARLDALAIRGRTGPPAPTGGL